MTIFTHDKEEKRCTALYSVYVRLFDSYTPFPPWFLFSSTLCSLCIYRRERAKQKYEHIKITSSKRPTLVHRIYQFRSIISNILFHFNLYFLFQRKSTTAIQTKEMSYLLSCICYPSHRD